MSIKEAQDNMVKTQARTYTRLGDVARRAGYPTVDEYCKIAHAALSKEDRKKYIMLENALIGNDSTLDKAMTLGRCVACITLSAGAIVPKLIPYLDQFNLILSSGALGVEIGQIVHEVHEYRMQHKLWREVHGVSDGAELIAMASIPVRPDLQSQGDELGVKVGVGAVAGTGAAVAKGWLQVFGAATVAVGVVVVLVQVGALVYEGIEGRKQKNKLQELILELASRRFVTKKAQLLVNASQPWIGQLSAIVMADELLQIIVDNGTITIEVKNQNILECFDKLIEDFKIDHQTVTEEVILKNLGDHDKDCQTWTVDDPNIDRIKVWLQEHPGIECP